MFLEDADAGMIAANTAGRSTFPLQETDLGRMEDNNDDGAITDDSDSEDDQEATERSEELNHLQTWEDEDEDEAEAEAEADANQVTVFVCR
jgi:hypothetical protein